MLWSQDLPLEDHTQMLVRNSKTIAPQQDQIAGNS